MTAELLKILAEGNVPTSASTRYRQLWVFCDWLRLPIAETKHGYWDRSLSMHNKYIHEETVQVLKAADGARLNELYSEFRNRTRPDIDRLSFSGLHEVKMALGKYPDRFAAFHAVYRRRSKIGY